MRRTTSLAAVSAAALATIMILSGCGGDPKTGGSAASSPSSAGLPPTSPRTSTPSPTYRPTQSSTLGRDHPGRLELVRADELPTAEGRCTAAPKQGVVCSPDGRRYRFDPERVQVVGVVSARARAGQTPAAWVVDLQFGPVGTRALAKLTRAAVNTHESALLMVPGTRRVVIAARVQSEIRDGNIEISGGYTAAGATRIVSLVTATAG